MFYFDRDDGLKSIPGRTDVIEEREILVRLCNIYWDVSEGKATENDHIATFRMAALYPQKIVWDWSLIGTMLLAEFHPPFQDLFVEMLLDRNQHVRYGMAEKLSQAGDKVVQAVLPTLVSSPDAELRRYAIELVSNRSNDVGSYWDVLPAFVSQLEVESSTDIKSLLKKQIGRIRRALSRSRDPSDVFDWDCYQSVLFVAMEEAIRRFCTANKGLTIRAGCLDCNAQYGQVLLSFDAQDANHAMQEYERWDIGSWSHFDVISGMQQEDTFFDVAWGEIGRYITANIGGDEGAPWQDPNAPTEQFMLMAAKVATRLLHSDVMKSMTTTPDFEFLAVEHDEAIEAALQRMERLVK